jgi:ubiquinone/menaquinone biosynthesis C-methylase UbiE
MESLKNWDNRTWLSSSEYIQKFNRFLLNQKKLNKNSKILDIGCGRGKIIGDLYTNLNLRNKPIGIDIENHKDKNKNMIFKKIDAMSFLLKTKENYDLILIKQTIHLLKFTQIKKLINICKKRLNFNGKIIILSLDPNGNELPTFSLMKKDLRGSLKRDKKIFNLINKIEKNVIKKKFNFKVKILKRKYLQMIKNKFISILLNYSKKQILEGIKEIDLNYDKDLIFNDKLICLSLNKD